MPRDAGIRVALSAFILFGAAGSACAAATTFPAPKEYPANHRFRVQVDDKASHVYDAKVSTEIKSHQRPYSNRFRAVGFTIFEMEGPATVKIEVLGDAPKKVRVLPSSLGLTPEVNGSTIAVRLQKPVNAIVELNDDAFDHLYLFASAPEKEPVDPKGPDTIYFGPGVHTPGTIEIQRDGQTVYLAGGAVVKGEIHAKGRSRVRIAGRGILTGDHHPEYKQVVTIMVRGCHDLRMDDIMILDAADTFAVRMFYCRNVTIRNMRQISYTPTSEGIDVLSCENVLVEGVFIRNFEDGVCCKAESGKSCRNVLTRKSTFVTDHGTSLKVGYGEMFGPEISNVVFEDCDVISPCGQAVKFSTGGSAHILDVRAENIRIQGFRMYIDGVRNQGRQDLISISSSPSYIYMNNFAPGTVRNVVLKDIALTSSDPKVIPVVRLGAKTPEGCIADVTFDNVTLDGIPLSPDHPSLELQENVHNIRFKSPGKPETVARGHAGPLAMPKPPVLPPLPAAEPVVAENGDVLIEAESGQVIRTMYRWADDPTASGQWYIGVRQGNKQDKPPDGKWATAEYALTLKEAGTYTLEGRMKGPAQPFWVRVDDGEWLVWGPRKDTAEWAWHPALDKEGMPLRFKLAAGQHKLVVSHYHTNGKLDRIKLAKAAEE